MKILLFIISLFILLSCLSENSKEKPQTVTSQKRKMSIAIFPDERLFKMNISPDTFYISVGTITPRIINHSKDTVSFGTYFSLEYFNQSTLSWENVLPQNLAYTLERRQIMPNSYYDYKFPLFNNQTPGKYRIALDLHTKLQNNIVIGAFFLTDDEKYNKGHDDK